MDLTLLFLVKKQVDLVVCWLEENLISYTSNPAAGLLAWRLDSEMKALGLGLGTVQSARRPQGKGRSTVPCRKINW